MAVDTGGMADGLRGDRVAWVSLALIALTACVVSLSVDLARLAEGHFWSDGATYHAMAHSLAEDFDLRYEARDVFRSRREFAGGPQGIFLKRTHGGFRFAPEAGFPWLDRVPEDDKRIYFAKSFAYPVAAAPLVALLRTNGLLLVNALALVVALLAAYTELRRRASARAALAASVVLIFGCVAPLYLLWPTPELFNVGVIAGGLWAWRRDRPLLAAVLLGIAIYSKPPNLFLALPLGVAPLVQKGGPAFMRRLFESVRRGAVLALAVAALYAANWAVTGEINYQGGSERKTFYGTLPFEAHGVTFGNSGIWMSTNQMGPRVDGVDDVARSQGAEPPRPLAEIQASFARNLGYFWIGRFGGALPYFFPLCVAALLFLAAGPRELAGWLALAALVVSELFYIWLIPDNWYGGSGTLGNRYFLNLLPLAPFLVPRGRVWVTAALGGLGAMVFVVPLFFAPMTHARDPGRHARQGPFRLLPLELTMLNDLSVFGDPRRKKQSYGDTEGDRSRPGSADPRAYYLYFPDDGTYFRESREGRPGFWVRGGARAEVVLRALEPVREVTLRVTGGPAGDEMRVSAGTTTRSASLEPGETRVLKLPPGSMFPYKETAAYVLDFRSLRGGREEGVVGTPRKLGTFVELELEIVSPR